MGSEFMDDVASSSLPGASCECCQHAFRIGVIYNTGILEGFRINRGTYSQQASVLLEVEQDEAVQDSALPSGAHEARPIKYDIHGQDRWWLAASVADLQAMRVFAK
jgi:hypothetical protein